MWGKNIGSLSIIKRYSYNTGGLYVVGNITGDQGDSWIRGEYKLSDANNNANFEVIFFFFKEEKCYYYLV